MSTANAQMPPQARIIDKMFEEAACTGVLRLNGRKLKEVPTKPMQKLDLSDTIEADLSKNRLHELPPFICELYLLSKLCVYSNLMKSLPSDGSLLTLQNLTHLNLSRNQISVIPQALCELPKLQVLIVSHNRLCSLPEELGHMANLSDLDVSCNEISFLPAQIGDLHSLKYLDLRKNLLVEVPIEICELEGLRRLDISENRIQLLPSQLRKMGLKEFYCDHNPLIMPPAALCTRGLIHIKKYLENEDRKRGTSSQIDPSILSENRMTLRQRESLRLTGLRNYPVLGKAKSELSGYSLSENQGNRSTNRTLTTHSKDDICATEEIRQFAEERMEFTRSPKKPPASSREESFAPSTPASSDSRTLCESFPLKNFEAPGSEAAKTLANQTENPPACSELSCSDSTFESDTTDTTKSMTPEEEFRLKHDAIVSKQRAEALKRTQKEAVMAFVKQRQAPVSQPQHPQHPPPPPPVAVSPMSEAPLPNTSFTIRRTLDRAREEQELQQRMRYIIETRLKMVLPPNLNEALSDGVVLCHLANNVRPRSVATIHVPSLATPKLTMAKCRRNVENFLDACKRLGVPQEDLCQCEDVVDTFDIHSLASTVEALTKVTKIKPTAPPPPPPRDSSQLSSNNNYPTREASPIKTAGPAKDIVTASTRTDSPVSTSEDISSLDNLDQDQSLGDEEKLNNLQVKSIEPSDTASSGVNALRARFEACNTKENRDNPKSDVEPIPAPSVTEGGKSDLRNSYIAASVVAGLLVIYLYYFHPYLFYTLLLAVTGIVFVYLKQ